MKKIVKLFTGAVICMSLLIMGLNTMKYVEAEESFVTEQLSMTEYSKSNAPEKDGYVFAGWFEDATCTTSVQWNGGSSETKYAKFVPEQVLTLLWQISKDTTVDSGSTNLRLVTAVDGQDYTEVGFCINNQERVSKTVYTKIYGADESFTPESLFGNSAKYFATYVITGAENDKDVADATDNFGASLTITPQWKTLDGTTVKGTTREVVINDALYEARVENLTGKGEKTDRVWYGTLETAVDEANKNTYTGEGIVTVLQDAKIEKTLNLSLRNISIQNQYGKDITISRAENFTDKMVYCSGSGKTQSLKRPDGDTAGSLTINAETSEAINTPVVELGSSDNTTVNFYLGEGVTITGANSTYVNGAVVRVKKSATAELYGNLTNNKTTAKSSLLHIVGTVTIGGGTYSGNTGADYGGVAYVTDTGHLTVNDGTFEQNKAYSGAVAYVVGQAKINGGTFKDNTTLEKENSSKGGVVYVAKGALEIKGGTFRKNSARLGGVVCNVANTQVTVAGGTFDENNVQEKGGVVYAIGTIWIHNGTFKQNKANNGGVLWVDGSATISDGSFNGNYVSGKDAKGGVIYLNGKDKSLSVAGGTFTGNTAPWGGVAYNTAGTINITGGTFTQNSATATGGGVILSNNGTVQISGTETSKVVMKQNFVSEAANNNTGTGGGGGAISLVNAANLTMSGCEILDNLHVGSDQTERNTKGCDIAFNRDEEKALTLSDHSFTGVLRNSTAMTKNKITVLYGDKKAEITDTKRYTVDYSGDSLLKEYE